MKKWSVTIIIKTGSELISPYFFFKKLLSTYLLQNGSLLLEHLEKSWESIENKIWTQFSATYKKK